MRKILFLSSLLVSGAALAGGSIGGGGLGKEKLEELMSIADFTHLGAMDVPDLGLSRTAVATSDYRRARARLSVDSVTTTAIKLQDGEVNARLLNGGIVNETADTQFVPGPN